MFLLFYYLFDGTVAILNSCGYGILKYSQNVHMPVWQY